MATTKEAILLVLDVGRNMALPANQQGDSYLDLAIQCIEWTVSRKIFAESKDEFGLILFGCDRTENPLNEEGQYENIVVGRELQLADFELSKYMEAQVKTTEIEGDFLDALVVALEVMREGTEGKKFAGRQIVLFSNLGGTLRDEGFGNIADGLAHMNVDFNVIGPAPDDHHDNDDGGDTGGAQGGAASASNGHHQSKLEKTTQMVVGEGIIRGILNSNGISGESYTLTEAMSTLSSFARRAVKPTAGKFKLEITDTIKVPVCMYLKIKENKIKQTWQRVDPTRKDAPVRMERIYERMAPPDEVPEVAESDDVQNDQQPTPHLNDSPQQQQRFQLPTEDEMQVDKEELVKAYRFGKDMVPFTDKDKESMKYQTEGKCFQILGFQKSGNIKRYLQSGEGVHYVLADADDQIGCVAFSALVQAMIDDSMVAIIRYCYNARSTPRIGVLMPKSSNKGCDMMIYITLPFSDDVRGFVFPEFPEKSQPTQDQLNAMDELIKSMDLTKAKVDTDGSRTEALRPRDIMNPQTQYVMQCLNHRALYPDQPLPQPDSTFMRQIEPIRELTNLAQPAIEKIKANFKLEKVEKAEKRTAAELFNKIGDTAGPSDKVMKQDNDVIAETSTSRVRSKCPSSDTE